MQGNSGNNILVSIVIPVHNGENYLAYTLDSVLSQTHSNLEVIVVNDGSTDRTKEIAESYSQKYPFIQTINKEKSGVSSARNSGYQKAKGYLISFLDADDIWLPDNLLLKIDYLIQHPEAFGVSSYCEIIDEDNKLKNEYKKGDLVITLENILEWKGNYITIPSGILFRTGMIRELNGFNTNLSNNADQEILMRALKTKKTFHTIQQVTWHYRRHSNNMSSNLDLMEKDTVLTYQLAIQNDLFKSWWFKKKCLSRMSMILAFSWWKDGKDKIRAMKWLVNSFRYSPVNFTDSVLLRLFIRNSN